MKRGIAIDKNFRGIVSLTNIIYNHNYFNLLILIIWGLLLLLNRNIL